MAVADSWNYNVQNVPRTGRAHFFGLRAREQVKIYVYRNTVCYYFQLPHSLKN